MTRNEFARELAQKAEAQRSAGREFEQELISAYEAMIQPYIPNYLRVLTLIEDGLNQELHRSNDMVRILQYNREVGLKHGALGATEIAPCPGDSVKVEGCQVGISGFLAAAYAPGKVTLLDQARAVWLEDEADRDVDGYTKRHNVVIGGQTIPLLRDLKFDPHCHKSQQALPLLVEAQRASFDCVSDMFHSGDLIDHILNAFDIVRYRGLLQA